MISTSKMRLRLIIACLAVVVLGLPASAEGISIPGAKLLADGVGVQLSAKIVTYASTDFFYIQEANAGTSLSDALVGGMRIKKSTHGFAVGARVNVSGAMRTNDKLERYIDCSTATNTTGTGTVVPWMMSNRSIGALNIGLLVRTTGFVSYVDQSGSFAYIDDGSALYDGNTSGPLGAAMPGLRVMLPASTGTLKTTQYVTVTGISSLETIAGLPTRAILAQTIVRDDASTLMSSMSMLCVPSGEFLMGNTGSGDDAVDGYRREYPQHAVHVPTFWISKYEVTRNQYNQFMLAGGYSNASYWSVEGWNWKLSVGRTQPSYWSSQAVWAPYIRPDFSLASFTQTDSHPVVGVSFHEAEAFCKWAGGRLPTEAEWEKAARWDGTPRVYPWGNAMDKTMCNDWYDTAYPGYQSAPVSAMPAAASPYGCLNMAGNVWEWTQDWYKSYPGSSVAFDKAGVARSVRGGGWFGVYGNRCASRWYAAPNWADNDIGFRLAR